MKAKVIAICNHKGGVGKTTTALNLAAGLIRKGYGVLLVDCDAQANLTDTLRATPAAYLYDMLTGKAAVEPTKITESLHLLPSSLDMANADTDLNGEIGREYLLRDVLENLSSRYDYILIDTAPSLGLLTINALAAAEGVIIPIQAEYYALKGLKGLTDIISGVKKRINKRLKISGIIVTQVDNRTTLHKQVIDAIGQQATLNLFSATIRNSIAIAEAQAKGCDIFTYAEESNAADDYRKVTEEFIKRT